MKKLPILLILLINSFVYSQNYKDSLKIKLTHIVENSKIPGIGVAIVSEKGILFKEGIGYADVDKKIPYKTNTIHNIGSISKTVIAFALMKLVEEQKINLDDTIDKYLPFKIVNPHFPDDKITIRQLATHTSSLTDGADEMIIEKTYLFNGNIDFSENELPEDYYEYFKIYQNNKQVSLKKFIKNTYCKNGNWYAKENFLNKKPGTTYNYSNIGSAVLAYIIERVAKKPYSEFTKEILFKSLGLKDSYWELNNIPRNQLASLYLSNGKKIPHYTLITYPDGGWFTSIDDFSKYYIEMMKGLNGKSKLLKKESYSEMMSNQLIPEKLPLIDTTKTKGLLWSVNKEGDNISADGSDPGVGTFSLFTTAGNVGIIIFRNMSWDGDEVLGKDIRNIQRTVFQNVKPILEQEQNK